MRIVLLCTLIVLAPRQATAQLKTVSLADAQKFETLGQSVLSADGQWIAYQISRSGGDNELRYRKLSEDSTRVAKLGDQPVFSRTGNWLAYRVSASETERARLQRQNQPVRDQLVLVDLRAGKQTRLEETQSFAFNHAGTHIAYRKYAPRDAKSRGANVVVRELATGIETNFGNVAEYVWQDRGTLIALALDGENSAGNGVQLYDATTATLRVLDSNASRYSQLTWRRRADDLTVLRTQTDSTFADTAHTVLAWRGVAAPNAQRFSYESDATNRIVSYRRPRWADDGAAIFFGVKRREPKLLAKAAADSTEKPEIDVWHYRDMRPQYAQKLTGARERERNALAAWTLSSGKLVQIADEKLDAVVLMEGQKAALVYDDQPHALDGLAGRTWFDVQRVDVASGARSTVSAKVPYTSGGTSATGRYVLFVKDGHWWTQDVSTGRIANISSNIKGAILDEDDDHPVHHRRPLGIAGWTANDRTVIVYDKYDLWEVSPDGARAVRLTDGAEQKLIYRYVRLIPEETTIDLSKPVYLSIANEATRASGYARLAGGKVQQLIVENKSVTGLRKAENADVFTYTVQSYEDSPDIFAADASLQSPRPLTQTNPFQKDYAWGKAELIEFRNARGHTSRAILHYPANYQPGQRYPMVVYIYEQLTAGLHQYRVPSDRQQYNPTNFVQAGYFVLQPDITYVPREPGQSTIDAVVPAIDRVVTLGLVDRARVGVFGHSWGGYGSAFLATHTNGVFAAAVAGAGLTDLISFYGYSSDNSGFPEHGHFEVGQERMQVSLWEDPDAYIRNSPIFTVHKMTTPLLIEHGDRDGNVDFGQGVELYNAARRNQKNVVMIVYNNENHGLVRKPNQQDYVRKQLEWFGHYLKGEPAPKWITDGVPFVERGK